MFIRWESIDRYGLLWPLPLPPSIHLGAISFWQQKRPAYLLSLSNTEREKEREGERSMRIHGWIYVMYIITQEFRFYYKNRTDIIMGRTCLIWAHFTNWTGTMKNSTVIVPAHGPAYWTGTMTVLFFIVPVHRACPVWNLSSWVIMPKWPGALVTLAKMSARVPSKTVRGTRAMLYVPRTVLDGTRADIFPGSLEKPGNFVPIAIRNMATVFQRKVWPL